MTKIGKVFKPLSFLFKLDFRLHQAGAKGATGAEGAPRAP
jgi:hypothetical protein